MSSVSSVPQRPLLPAELWGLVFTHVDAYTVWMVCRNVSKLFRDEAEGEFARFHLPRLHFQGNFRLKDTIYQEKHYFLGFFKTTQLVSCPKDKDRAIFDIDVHFQLSRDERERAKRGDGKMMMPWTSKLKDQIRQELEQSDIDGFLTFGRKLAFIGPSVNEIEINYVEFDWENSLVVIRWKAFLTDFYIEEHYVRNGRKALGLRHDEDLAMSEVRDFTERIKTMKVKGTTQLDRQITIFLGGHLSSAERQCARLYYEALELRLRKVHSRDDRFEPLSNDAKRYLSKLRRVRRIQAAISFLESQGDSSRSSRRYEKVDLTANTCRTCKRYTKVLIHANISKVLVRAWRKHFNNYEAYRGTALSCRDSRNK
jgi:hypothetical protein